MFLIITLEQYEKRRKKSKGLEKQLQGMPIYSKQKFANLAKYKTSFTHARQYALKCMCSKYEIKGEKLFSPFHIFCSCLLLKKLVLFGDPPYKSTVWHFFSAAYLAFFVFAECTALEQEGTSLLQWFFQRTLGATGNVFVFYSSN